ncbi:probable ATP-dependent RNA helicase DDX28 [Ornithorhynchus anatinus]|uniref:probable ATP-dependent RNA helicase DDX28 n=1 Tax=Ornithorhynchus anatinus TaxID=9258 RepID=UPI0010A93AC7|nr:probable ATP-dependent RNA helicase DDX28 [Ornithorhynchus anatinus]
MGLRLPAALFPRRGPEAGAAGAQLAVIRIPRALQLRRERAPGSPGSRFPQPGLSRPGRLLINARRPQLNQPANLTLGRWDSATLASAGWKHRKALGDYFVIERSQDEPPALGQAPESGEGFGALGLEPALLEALRLAAPSALRPTAVQLRAIPALLRGRHTLLAAETGSGKTLGYLLPLMQRLLHRPPPSRAAARRGPAEPRGLVLVPSRELADQVWAVLDALRPTLDLSVRKIGGGHRRSGIGPRPAGASRLDVLVATPGALGMALKRRQVTLRGLCFLVLDEADTLLDQSFLELVDYILRKSPVAPDPTGVAPKAQLVLVAATLPQGIGRLLEGFAEPGRLAAVTSPRLHRVTPNVSQRFLRLKGAAKAAELLQILKQRSKGGPDPTGAVVVFCNTSGTVNWLGHVLDEHNVRYLKLQGEMPAALRAGVFKSFQEGFRDILLCTDIASRGLDSIRVELVVNYDFPLTLQDYIHRAGRVGRVGSVAPGSVISFVTHRWDVDLVQKIELSARRRKCLPGLDTEVKKLMS